MAHGFYREFDRRDFVKFSLAGALGVSYSGWLPRLARAAGKPRRRADEQTGRILAALDVVTSPKKLVHRGPARATTTARRTGSAR